jgi:hypothetical protein
MHRPVWRIIGRAGHQEPGDLDQLDAVKVSSGGGTVAVMVIRGAYAQNAYHKMQRLGVVSLHLSHMAAKTCGECYSSELVALPAFSQQRPDPVSLANRSPA